MTTPKRPNPPPKKRSTKRVPYRHGSRRHASRPCLTTPTRCITSEWLLAGHGPPRTRASSARCRDADRSRISATADASRPSATRCSTLDAPCPHRLPGRLVRRGRHPHGRPARTAPVGPVRRRRGIRSMASPLTAFRRTVKTQSGLDDLQHHRSAKCTPAACARISTSRAG